jgi:hypothetical protein
VFWYNTNSPPVHPDRHPHPATTTHDRLEHLAPPSSKTRSTQPLPTTWPNPTLTTNCGCSIRRDLVAILEWSQTLEKRVR